MAFLSGLLQHHVLQCQFPSCPWNLSWICQNYIFIDEKFKYKIKSKIQRFILKKYLCNILAVCYPVLKKYIHDVHHQVLKLTAKPVQVSWSFIGCDLRAETASRQVRQQRFNHSRCSVKQMHPSADSDHGNNVTTSLTSVYGPAEEQKSGLKRFFNESLPPVIAVLIDPDLMHPQLLSPDFLSSPEQFSCGRVYISAASTSTARRRRSLTPPPDSGIDGDLGYDYSDLNATEQQYEYEDSRPVNSTLNLRSARTQTAGGADPQPTYFPLWDYFAALPNVTAKENQDQRIVGGEEASPGQLPWQVPRAEWSDAHMNPAGLGLIFQSPPITANSQPIYPEFNLWTQCAVEKDDTANLGNNSISSKYRPNDAHWKCNIIGYLCDVASVD